MNYSVVYLLFMLAGAAIIVLAYNLRLTIKQKKIFEHQVPMLAQEMFQTFKSDHIDAEMKIYRDIAIKEAEMFFEIWKTEETTKIRAQAIKQSGATVIGKVSEHIAPFAENFPFNPRDCRFLGSPVDIIVFDGHTEGLDDIEVVFIEVKTSAQSRLTDKQKAIKAAVMNKKVKWLQFDLKA